MVHAAVRRDFISSSLATWPLGSAVVSAPPLCGGHLLAFAPEAARAHKPAQAGRDQSSDWGTQACPAMLAFLISKPVYKVKNAQFN